MNAVTSTRLANHRLVGRQFKTSAAAVSWFGAVQAQEFAFAKWAISQRTGLTDAKVEQAFNRGEILRTHVLRPTWHFVAPNDIRWMLALTGPRIRSAMSSYSRTLGIDAAQERKSRQVFERALAGKSLTRNEIREELRRARIDVAGTGRLPHFLMYAEISGLITSGPRVGNQFTYALLEERAAATAPIERDEALGELAKRYFQSRRPATIRDFVWWSGLITADARRVEISGVTTGETTKAVAQKSSSSVHLLPIYDEYPLCYRDRTAAMSKHRAQGRAGSIFVHLVVINGLVEGFWTRALGDTEAVIAVQPFRRLTKPEWSGIEREGERHAAFLGLPVRISRS